MAERDVSYKPRSPLLVFLSQLSILSHAHDGYSIAFPFIMVVPAVIESIHDIEEPATGGFGELLQYHASEFVRPRNWSEMWTLASDLGELLLPFGFDINDILGCRLGLGQCPSLLRRSRTFLLSRRFQQRATLAKLDQRFRHLADHNSLYALSAFALTRSLAKPLPEAERADYPTNVTEHAGERSKGANYLGGDCPRRR